MKEKTQTLKSKRLQSFGKEDGDVIILLDAQGTVWAPSPSSNSLRFPQAKSIVNKK